MTQTQRSRPNPVRTLRRRLADEGVSFRGLLDEICEQPAEELLVTGGRLPGPATRTHDHMIGWRP